jgi:CRISPR-associated protein Cmr2
MSQSIHLHWRRKLHALLHDSPDKACNIASHELRAAMIKALDRFEPAEFFDKSADWSASAADRIPFPHHSKFSEKLADLPAFNHPLGGAKLTKDWNFASENEAMAVSQKTRPFLLDTDDARAAFICAWRFWRNWASDSDPRFTFLPADTRIPDHSIWHHMGVTSAFQGAMASKDQKTTYPDEDLRPRLLLFSVGPVQDFIAAARSTRDLWSGSYLLSYLISTTLGTIAKEIGPDQVMFPNLLDQPLIDHHLSEGIFEKVTFSEHSIEAGLGYATDPKKRQKLLTPSLPNRFLALLPARMPVTDMPIDEYASSLVQDLTNKLRDIAGSVSDFMENHPSKCRDFDRVDFDAQVEKLLEVHWQTLPIPESISELQTLAKLIPDDQKVTDTDRFPFAPRKALEAILCMTEKCKPQHQPNTTTGWGLLNALLSWLHDGAKAQRPFEAWRQGRWESGKKFNKDSLNGKEEAVLQIKGTEAAVKAYCTGDLQMSQSTFKPGEMLGASTLIKRLWHETFLSHALNIDVAKSMPMPNTYSIAAGHPFAQDERDGTDKNDSTEKYYAILALDGDEMGKWISGSKSPAMGHCLSPKAAKYYQENAPDFLEAPRAVTPSWHLQFSEALGNFSLHAAQRVVEAFNGRLIYAGGDDVLAMLPATEALSCARALRAAFRGEKSLNSIGEGLLFNIQHDGYLQLHPDSGAQAGDQAKLLSDPVKFPAIVPGPAADVSVGIAIAHFKSPLQDVVKAAQTAEKRAKNDLGRGAVAISLFKRSGEILEWGCNWAAKEDGVPTSQDSAGYQLLHTLIDALKEKRLNGRFPHKFEALLMPYLPSSSSISTDSSFEENFTAILTIELDHCLSRNDGGQLKPQERELFTAYWNELSDLELKDKLTRFINLLRTAAWMSRGDATDESTAKRNQLAPA